MIVKSANAKSPVTTACTHCGLPVPAGLFNPKREEQFCCGGCDGAYRLIHDCGLDSFYAMANSTSDSMTLKDRKESSSRFAEFGSEPFLKKYASANRAGQPQVKLAIEGIHCAACIWLIEKLPSIVPGVLEARMNWSRGTVTVSWIDEQVTLSTIASTLHQLGYTPYPIRESEKANRFKLENRKHLSRLGVAAAIAGNNMIISAAMYLGMFSHMSTGMTQLMRVASCVVGLAALLFPGRVFLKSAFYAIRTKTPHMDLPIALALLVGTVVGTINVIRGTGEIYFDSLAVLIFLLLIGRWLQFRQQSRAADAVEMLHRMTPRTTRKLVHGEPVETLVELVVVEDLLEVHAGELLPADGTIVKGQSNFDESILTGESVAIQKTTGDEVFAGTLNTASKILLQATATGNSTRLSKIADLIEESGSNRPQMVQWANQIGGWFVVAVLSLAAFTMLFWIQTSVEVAVDRTIALLIVACPCALALATPLAIAVALGRASQSKLMVKSGDVLQLLQNPGMIWLDKTGTLTEGSMKVDRWYGDTKIAIAVAALEANSKHPIASALVDYGNKVAQTFANKPGDLRRCIEFNEAPVQTSNEITGLGIVGLVEGDVLVVGKLELLEANDISPTYQQRRLAEKIASFGQSPCWIGMNGRVAGIVAISDSVRPEASDAIAQLRSRGWGIGILSGDHQKIVNRVARRLGIESKHAIGNASPEAKLEIIKTTLQDQSVLMVGDGVNDSAALAAATVGMAVKGGAEASLAAASVYLAKPGLAPILELMRVSDSTARTMKRNLCVSLTYNVCFAGLAFAGFINPLVAAILMPISSLTVVSLSLRAGKIHHAKKGEQ